MALLIFMPEHVRPVSLNLPNKPIDIALKIENEKEGLMSASYGTNYHILSNKK
jgi:hypothetical protein